MEPSCLHEFSDYLIDVGFYPSKSNIQYPITQTNSYPNQKILLVQSQLFLNYLNSLNQDQKQILSLRVTNKYYENMFIKKIEKLKSILLLINSKNSKNKNSLSYFYKWLLFSKKENFNTLSTTNNLSSIQFSSPLNTDSKQKPKKKNY